MDKLISLQRAIDAVHKNYDTILDFTSDGKTISSSIEDILSELPSAEPERKTGRWILDRSGAYCCDKCMEPCATYAMMKPRDKFCKMCGAKMEDERKE